MMILAFSLFIGLAYSFKYLSESPQNCEPLADGTLQFNYHNGATPNMFISNVCTACVPEGVCRYSTELDGEVDAVLPRPVQGGIFQTDCEMICECPDMFYRHSDGDCTSCPTGTAPCASTEANCIQKCGGCMNTDGSIRSRMGDGSCPQVPPAFGAGNGRGGPVHDARVEGDPMSGAVDFQTALSLVSTWLNQNQIIVQELTSEETNCVGNELAARLVGASMLDAACIDDALIACVGVIIKHELVATLPVLECSTCHATMTHCSQDCDKMSDGSMLDADPMSDDPMSDGSMLDAACSGCGACDDVCAPLSLASTVDDEAPVSPPPVDEDKRDMEKKEM